LFGPIELPVPFIPQQPGLCGAACAQMVLCARDAIGSSPDEQRRLWADIQAHTRRTTPSPHRRKCTTCGFFARQICERFGDSAQCWCTHPRALAVTLNRRLDGESSFAVVTGDERAITATALNRIDHGIASVMLVYGTRHWVVVHGYTPVEDGGMVLGNHRVSHIHILNPQGRDAHDAHRAIPIRAWMADYMAVVPFGAYSDRCVLVTEKESGDRFASHRLAD